MRVFFPGSDAGSHRSVLNLKFEHSESTMTEKPEISDADQPDKGLKNYAQYAGMGFQMIVIIGLFTFIGYQIDESREASVPLFTAIFSVLGVGIALYQVIKTLTKK